MGSGDGDISWITEFGPFILQYGEDGYLDKAMWQAKIPKPRLWVRSSKLIVLRYVCIHISMLPSFFDKRTELQAGMRAGSLLLLGNHNGAILSCHDDLCCLSIGSAKPDQSEPRMYGRQITTVGYGDLTAQTFDEIIVSIVVLIVGAVAFV